MLNYEYNAWAAVDDDYERELRPGRIIQWRNKPKKTSKKSTYSQNAIGATVRSGAEGAAETIIGKVFIDKLSNIHYLFGTNWSTGLPTLIGSESKTFTKFFKGTSKIAGPVAAASLLYDIYSDARTYRGAERKGAIGLTISGFIITTVLTAAVAAISPLLIGTLVAGALIGGVVGTIIQNGKIKRYGND